MNMLFYVKIIRYCISYYNIFSFEEIIGLLNLKKIKYDKKLSKDKIIIYFENNNLKCDYILKIIEDKIILSSTIIEIPKHYLCINMSLNYKLKDIIYYYVVLLIMFIFVFINIKVTFILFVFACFLKPNYIIILNMLVNVIIINIILYQNYFAIISLVIICGYFLNKYSLYFSFIPLLLVVNYYAINLFIVYVLYIVLYKIYCNYKIRINKEVFIKMMIKHPINKVNKIKINNKIITKYGIYFFEIDSLSKIEINGINLNYLAIENLSKELEMVYVKNINSFFTNRQKYSKIDNVSKFYIFLKNI